MNRRIFTLIELLVVIAIISILASLLLPALRMAKNKGLSSQCLSNVRQCGVILNLYGSDYNQVIPSKFGASDYCSWYECMAENDYAPTYESGQAAVVVCPTTPGGYYDAYCVYGILSPNWATGTSYWKNYLALDPTANRFLDLKKYPKYESYSQISPSKFILLMDSSWLQSQGRYPRPFSQVEPHRITSTTGGMTFPHDNHHSNNSLFIDGHAARAVRGASLYNGGSTLGSIIYYVLNGEVAHVSSN